VICLKCGSDNIWKDWSRGCFDCSGERDLKVV